MCKTVLLDGVPEGPDDMVLPENISKGAGTVFSGKNLVAHASIVTSNEGLSGLSLGISSIEI